MSVGIVIVMLLVSTAHVRLVLDGYLSCRSGVIQSG